MVGIPDEIHVVLGHPAARADGGDGFLPGEGVGEAGGIPRGDAKSGVGLQQFPSGGEHLLGQGREF